MDQLEKVFFAAAVDNNINVVKKAIEDGVNVNVKNEQKRTALMRCAKRGRIQMTRLLLDSG